MSDSGGLFDSLRQKMLSALALLFLFSLVVHVSAKLLAPVLPVVVAFIILVIIWRVVFSRRRWE